MDSAVTNAAKPLSGFAYSDVNRLASIKTQGPGGLRAAAQQFEAMFIDMVMSSMRQAGAAFAQNDYTSSDATRMQQEMLDHQWAIHIAEAGGVGLADVIVRQLGGDSARAPSGRPAAIGAPADARSAPGVVQSADADVAALRTEPLERTPDLPAGFPAPPLEPIVRSAQPDDDLTVTEMGGKDSAFDGPADFVEQVLPILQHVLAGSGLNPISVLAQGALETGWGAHVIHTVAGDSSHNLFNIKASSDWDGPAVEVSTVEVRGGLPVQQRDRFRAYDSVESAVRDYVSLLRGDSRYRRVFDAAQDPARFADELQKAGYATDPHYATKILRVLTSGPLRAALEHFGG